MWNKIKNLFIWLWGPRKTIQQSLQEVADNMNEISYNNTPNIQGQKLEVEHGVSFKLIKGGKNET